MAPTEGEYRLDRWGFCWCYLYDDWVPVTNAQGFPTHSTVSDIPRFSEQDDPSSLRDPRPAVRMERIERKLDALIRHLGIEMDLDE